MLQLSPSADISKTFLDIPGPPKGVDINANPSHVPAPKPERNEAENLPLFPNISPSCNHVARQTVVLLFGKRFWTCSLKNLYIVEANGESEQNSELFHVLQVFCGNSPQFRVRNLLLPSARNPGCY